MAHLDEESRPETTTQGGPQYLTATGIAHATAKGGYGAAFDIYHRLGWPSVLPLKRATKWPPPTGYTGYDGIDPSYADMQAWADSDEYRDGNLVLRMIAMCGIDVDAHSGKTGAATLAECEKRCGTLPPTYRSTSRSDGVSGIRLYRIPDGVKLVSEIEFPELGIGAVEICQRHHRYTTCWPSVHEDTGEVYRWIDELDGTVMDNPPAYLDIPELPQKWLEFLTEPEPQQRPVNGAPVDRRVEFTGDEVAPWFRAAFDGEIDTLARAPYGSRETTCNAVCLRLYRLHLAGGFPKAMVDEAVWQAARAASGNGPLPFTDAEIERKLTHCWEDAQKLGPATDVPPPEVIDVQPGTLSPAGAAHDYRPPEPSSDLDAGFWDRESLHTVYTTALARMCSPWAVLAHCAARALALTAPLVTLPPLVGGPGSLNWFAAVTAISGGGKGAASAAARQLVPLRGVPIRNLGSGEGMITAYQVKADDECPEGLRQSVMFLADEIDAVTALGSRTGSTTMAVLRSGFSGETLGFSYATKGRDIHLAAHTYRMVVVFSVQPARARGLLGDHGGGTPQRFQWFPGTDPRVTAEVASPFEQSALTLPDFVELGRAREIIIPTAAQQLIVSERAKAMRGEADALDGHALFVREKFAYALAVLDGRMHMTDEDWELSGIAAAVSAHTREQVAQRLAEAEAEEAARVGTLRGITNQAADEEKAFRANQRANRVAAWIVEKITAATDGLSEGELRRQAYSRDRSLIGSVLTQLATTGVIKHDADAKKWVVIKK
ncbi:bifunctional DNA primase/polymerase [Mycolicibacterium sp. D5.8-2]|jgi:hypothetical protein|uniref:bifunctional DNA primase/polymerase n=1 Tax=Mycolicibacterium sp. D5.8-2 TaxID=3085903 RepID=UPI00298C8E03|nr:bifunctional DNA primase/polymerase [Mycolicibacterium sp. D5.8-2]MDW5610012.1 bifunctional DNA primase/polymerase [Mycolicibacterium sp. D5.8-2]